jgi:hypothetical protein
VTWIEADKRSSQPVLSRGERWAARGNEVKLIVQLRQRILLATDRVLGATVLALVAGSALCFGGAVWWFPAAAAALALVLAGCTVAQLLAAPRIPVLKSPLTLLGLLALALGMIQLVPLPASLARRLSPSAQAIYAYGVMPRLARADLPSVALTEPAQVRSPATLDRAATLRWLVGAAICLGVFWSVSQFADRIGRLYLLWGSIVAAFLTNGAIALVQLAGSAEGLFGFLRPGGGVTWAPSFDSLLETPALTFLRPLGDPPAAEGSLQPFQPIAVLPERSLLFGTMPASRGAFLAMGAIALPLALAIVLHLIAPRGSREPLVSRLGHTGQGGLVLLLLVMLVLSAFLLGMAAGPWFCLPFLIGVAAVGIPGAAGWRWPSLGVTALLVMSIGLGAALAGAWPAVGGGRAPLESVSWEHAKLVWNESLAIAGDFPLVGTGLGSFATVAPYWKTRDAASTTAMSSLLQCAVESGAIGIGLVAAAVLWSLWRLPASLRRVGSADRTLAYGLIGAAASFGLWSVVQWSVELPAVAISASALGGTWNRWLAGGTDLFVERE